jgi:hypothetical protein
MLVSVQAVADGSALMVIPKDVAQPSAPAPLRATANPWELRKKSTCFGFSDFEKEPCSTVYRQM